jgi:acetyl-CoA carboxylase biotin carboxylase subunit
MGRRAPSRSRSRSLGPGRAKRADSKPAAAKRAAASGPRRAARRLPHSPARFRRVLIANRGEIAVRVIRTLRELGITSIAVFSEPDREALHVLLADEAYPIGPGPARESYLDLERVLDTARSTRADAVHPGYGFFAENADFARGCEQAGLSFIGPAPATIEMLGDKLAAREVARRARVPLIPASGALADLAAARREAERLGYPIVLKAAAGGGGKGIRVVRREAELASAWELTRGEARGAFGDERVYAERYLERPRHVEAQILGDAAGGAVFLGERECSVQRRHQKLLEETPSPALDPRARAALGEAACRIARAVGYRNAGTVEFVLDEAGRFYFLEVNTRLQVEHPVTEMVTGLDLVAEQVRIAEDRPTSFGARPPAPRGWSMEARVIAEDPAAGFMPAVGRIERIRLPQGPGVRNDAGVYRGYTIPIHYDSLLAKLVVWGADREQARRRLLRALDEYVLEGVHHNLAFHRWLASHPEFAAGRLSTRFLEDHFTPETLAPGPDVAEVALIAAALHARLERQAITLPAGAADGSSAWRWAERRGAGGRRAR